jgi:hypothetical protein
MRADTASPALSGRAFVVFGLVLVTALALLPVATAAAKPGTRAHPYKRGALVRVDGGFAIRVLSTDTNAWRSIQLQGSGNRAPAPGRSDVLVTMRATNRSRIQGIPFVDGELGAIGRFGNTYSSLTSTCGTITRDVSAIDPAPPGKTVIVRTCWQVPTFDAKSLVMSYAPYDDSRKTYFALR